jgi:hypothetical protein
MKIRLVRTELFREDGQTDRHDEADSPFRSLQKAPTITQLSPFPPINLHVGVEV